MEFLVKQNASNHALKIGRVDRAQVSEDVQNLIRAYGRIVTSSKSLANTLDANYFSPSELKREVEDSAKAGETVVAIDASLGQDFRFYFIDPKFHKAKKTDRIQFPAYFVVDYDWGLSSVELIKLLNKEVADLVEAYLNNNLYGYEVEVEDEDGTGTHCEMEGAFASLEEAERAALEDYPDYSWRVA